MAKEYKRVIVVGHSEGALIGLIATQGNSDVDAYISIAGCGRSADVILLEQLNAQSPEMAKEVAPMFEILKRDETIKEVPQSLYSLFRPSVQPYMISWIKHDPCVEIAALKVPILVIQGDMDIQISVKDAEMLCKAQPKAKKLIIKNMNHVLKQCDTMDMETQLELYDEPMLRNIEALGKEIVSFIN